MADPRTIPDVVIAGAAKTGTTALSRALHANGEFFVGSEKEPRYFSGLRPDFVGPTAANFNRTMIVGVNAYAANFANAGNRRTVDASTNYLNRPSSAHRIAKANPKARIIIGLRHPVTRAWSEHTQLVLLRAEDLSFEEALEVETERVRGGPVVRSRSAIVFLSRRRCVYSRVRQRPNLCLSP